MRNWEEWHGNEVELEIDKLVGKSELGQIISRCFARHGAARTAEVLDRIKRLGFDYATKGAITVGVKDAVVPAEKKALIKEAEDKVRSEEHTSELQSR